MPEKQSVHIVWLKRDLRIIDHEPIKKALHPSVPTLFLYILEPIILNDLHYSERHFNFIKQSLSDLNDQLTNYHTKVLAVEGDALATFNRLSEIYEVKKVFSYQETGLGITFKRDIAVSKWFKSQRIPWHESVQNGVQRGWRNRNQWKDTWEDFMNKPLDQPDFNDKCVLSVTHIDRLAQQFKAVHLPVAHFKQMQYGGTTTAFKYLDSFYKIASQVITPFILNH